MDLCELRFMIESQLLILPMGGKESQSGAGQSHIIEQESDQMAENLGLLSPQTRRTIDNGSSLSLEICVYVKCLVSDNIINYVGQKS